MVHAKPDTMGTTTATTVDKRDQTGLLTRFLASATASLAIFSSRVYKVYRLINSIKTRRGVNNATGAVEGILAAAVLYTLLATLMSLSLKGGGARWLRWLWVLLDLLFVGAFIAVAVLTRPNGGHAGPRHCYGERDVAGQDNVTGNVATGDDTCDLPWGTFALAIASTILHAITAAFHEVRHHYKQNRYSTMSEAPMVGGHQGYNGTTGNGMHQTHHGTNGAGEYPPAGAPTGPARV
ncbi:hypothetical protein QBC34DRAFT_443357 [Podospora aff. communis PSN243]|uniref:MARVEL domain-containing protein n=1 Tax=Podospora aff. communis PSN243 TaxID=3040156 RepID=A0AAV9G861_9PEZI|nr:hypothetical protein QBC34DRAFT_443357 [Podospora aff. communis PSN243]